MPAQTQSLPQRTFASFHAIVQDKMPRGTLLSMFSKPHWLPQLTPAASTNLLLRIQGRAVAAHMSPLSLSIKVDYIPAWKTLTRSAYKTGLTPADVRRLASCRRLQRPVETVSILRENHINPRFICPAAMNICLLESPRSNNHMWGTRRTHLFSQLAALD